MDAFYASIEQRDHPELRNRPVIVGAASARGVVAAASYEARKYGIHSAMPGFRARELCPHAVFLPANIGRYAEVSDQVHAVFEEFTPAIEPLALDEAFLDVTESVVLFRGPLALAQRLRERVREATDLVVSVGVGPSKLVAKIASKQAKPDGLVLVEPERVLEFLRPLPVRAIWGIGPVLGNTLAQIGIQTIGDLADAGESRLERVVGDRAHSLLRMAAGDDERDVVADRAPKSFGEESTFERDVSARDVVTAALTAHAEAVARRLRQSGYLGRTVTLKVKLGARRGTRLGRQPDGQSAPWRGDRTGTEEEPIYPSLTRSRTLSHPTDDGAVIRRAAVELWDAAAVREAVRLLGVSVSSLESAAPEQLELFGQRPFRNLSADRLGPALDAIRARFGDRAIGRAVQALEKATPALRKKRGD
jgi:DNA polymerase-4